MTGREKTTCSAMHDSKDPSARPCRGPLLLWAALTEVVAWAAIVIAVNRLACSAWRDDSVMDAPGAARASSTGVVMSTESGREPDKNPVPCARDDGAAQHASSSSAKHNMRGASARLGSGAARWDVGSALLHSARHGSSSQCALACCTPRHHYGGSACAAGLGLRGFLLRAAVSQ